MDEATYRTFTKEQMCREVLGGDFSLYPWDLSGHQYGLSPKQGMHSDELFGFA